uniref:SPEM family member 3 n=1 Tax=Pipistrellus kuhlii TaxID=59472 RepID=A0A7J7TXK4_PIPKU|nr:hypothetical protein mPipKuh1_009215 [Pipistrellus kuhlii]
MGEQARHGAPVCSGTNSRKCQDLGDSILLILGSFILLNVGINVVTLLWRHLKCSLRILFHHFFPKDKQPHSIGNQPTGMSYSADSKNLCLRVPSRFHRCPSLLLRSPKQPDSCTPDTNDEKEFRWYWLKPQYGHARAPIETPRGLWREGMKGAREAPHITAAKAQDTYLSRQGTSSPFPRTSKLNMVPLCLPQGNKTKTPDYAPAKTWTHPPPRHPEHTPTQAQIRLPVHSCEHTPTQAQTCPPAQPPEHNPTQAQTCPPAQPPEHNPTKAQACPPVQPPEHNPTKAQTCPPAQPPEHNPTKAQTRPPAQPCEHNPTQAQTRPPAQPCEHNPTQAQTCPPAQPPEHYTTKAQTCPPAQPPEHNTTKAQTCPPAQPSEHILTQAQTRPPVHLSENTPTQAQVHSIVCTPEHTGTQVHGPEHTSAHTLAQDPAKLSLDAFGQSLDYILEHLAVPTPTSNPAHPTYTHAHKLVPPPPSAPEPPLTSSLAATPAPAPVPKFASILAPALVMAPTTTPVPTHTPPPTPSYSLTPTPSALAAFNQDLSAGHVFYAAPMAKKTLFYGCPTQNTGYSRRDLGTFTRPQDRQRLVNSSKAEQIFKQLSGDTANTPTGPIVGYLESENMGWNNSNDAEDKVLQPKTFPYCSFHPCNSERRNTDSQPPAYPKFLVYSKDDSPSQPCFHSPTGSVQNSRCAVPPPYTLSLPLVSPRSFILQQPTNHQVKPSTLTQAPTLPPVSILSSQFPIPSQFSTISQPPIQPQSSELHESLGLIQDSGLQRTPGPSKDSKVPKNPGLGQDPGLKKMPDLTQHPHLCKSSGPSQDPGLHKNPVPQESGPEKCLGPPQNVGVFRSPYLTQPPGFHKNKAFLRNPDIQRNSGFVQETVLCKNQDLSQTTGVHNSPGLPQDSGGYKSTAHAQDQRVARSLGLTQDSGPQKGSCLAKDSEVNKSSGQESGLYKNPGLAQTCGLHKGSGLTKDSGDYRNVGLTKDCDPCANPGLTQASEAKKRGGLTQDVGMYRNPEHTPNPNFHRYAGIQQDSGPQKGLRVIQDASFPVTHGLTKESSLLPNPDSHKNPGRAPGTNSAQVLGPSQTPKSSQPLRSFVYEETPQKNAEQHPPWAPDPASQYACPSKAQVVYSDLQTFSEVPVLIELQPSSHRVGGQDWVYHPVDTVPPAYQNYHQMPVPPKPSLKTHCPGASARVGHVVFDARQRPFGVGRDKCEALSPRRFSQQASGNSLENTEWGYQCVMRPSEKERTRVP